MTQKKPIKVVDVGVYEKLIIDLEWLEENNYYEIKQTGQFDEGGFAVLTLNGENLGNEEKILVPFFSDEDGCVEVESLVDYFNTENIFRIYEYLHEDDIQSKVVYAKRMPKDHQK